MHLLISIHTARSRSTTLEHTTLRSGIIKPSISGAIPVTAHGVMGDHIVNMVHHGGPDQAVYLYGEPDYLWWEAQLGTTLDRSWFGQNLLVSDWSSQDACVGDILQIDQGDTAVQFELTGPRIACGTFNKVMAHIPTPPADWVKRFNSAGRTGAYARVLRAGSVQAGDVIDYQPVPSSAQTRIRINDVMAAIDNRYMPREQLAQILQAPLARRLMQHLQSRLDIAD